MCCVPIKLYLWSWALVAHTCNLSYSGGKDQEDHSSKPARAIVLSRKTFHRNRAGGMAQCEGPEFKPQYCKKTKTAATKKTPTLFMEAKN
jgi:hypothetical protein